MTSKKIDKKALVTLIIQNLKKELSQAVNAANEAHASAIDDQSIAETQYDTLAIEASYLAEGQSRRVQELHAAIKDYQTLSLLKFNDNNVIALSALVQLAGTNQEQNWFFIGPAAGGFRCQLNNQHITVLTPKSPMGLALIGKFLDDDVDIIFENKKLTDYIELVQ